MHRYGAGKEKEQEEEEEVEVEEVSNKEGDGAFKKSALKKKGNISKRKSLTDLVLRVKDL